MQRTRIHSSTAYRYKHQSREHALTVLDNTIAILVRHGADFDRPNIAGLLPFTTAMQRDYYREKSKKIKDVIQIRRSRAKHFMRNLAGTLFSRGSDLIRQFSAKKYSQSVQPEPTVRRGSVLKPITPSMNRQVTSRAIVEGTKQWKGGSSQDSSSLFSDIRIQKAVDAEWQARARSKSLQFLFLFSLFLISYIFVGMFRRGVNNPATFEFENSLKVQLVEVPEFQNAAYYSDVYTWFDHVFVDFVDRSAAVPVWAGTTTSKDSVTFLDDNVYVSQFARVIGTPRLSQWRSDTSTGKGACAQSGKLTISPVDQLEMEQCFDEYEPSSSNRRSYGAATSSVSAFKYDAARESEDPIHGQVR
jgi:hypothetical protein